jgi:hypothetical protein
MRFFARPLALALTAAAVLLSASPSQAGLFDCFGCGSATTAYYAPASPCCGGTAAYYAPTVAYRPGLFPRLFGWLRPRAAVVGYAPTYYGGSYASYYGGTYAAHYGAGACCAPQTCYRPVMVNVPVTTYQTYTSYDPCTGCPTTCMRPVTTCVQQVRYVAQPCCPTTCCPTSCCATSGCDHCAGYAGGVITQQTTTLGLPTTQAGGAETTSPSLPKTYGESNGQPREAEKPSTQGGNMGEDKSALQNGTGTSSSNSPNIVDPNNRSTSNPDRNWTFRRAVATGDETRPSVKPVADESAKTARKIDDGGWESVGR